MDTWAWLLWITLAVVTLVAFVLALIARQAAAEAKDRAALNIDHGETVATLVVEARDEATQAARRAENAAAVVRGYRADCVTFRNESLAAAGRLADRAEPPAEFLRIAAGRPVVGPHNPKE